MCFILKKQTLSLYIPILSAVRFRSKNDEYYRFAKTTSWEPHHTYLYMSPGTKISAQIKAVSYSCDSYIMVMVINFLWISWCNICQLPITALSVQHILLSPKNLLAEQSILTSTELFYRFLSSADTFHGFPTLKRIVFPRPAKCTRSFQLLYQSHTLPIQVHMKFYKHKLTRSFIPRAA